MLTNKHLFIALAAGQKNHSRDFDSNRGNIRRYANGKLPIAGRVFFSDVGNRIVCLSPVNQ